MSRIDTWPSPSPMGTLEAVMANRCRSETAGAMTEAGVDAVLAGLASALPEGFLRVERSGGSWTLRFGRADRTDPPAALWMEDGGEIGWPHVPDPARWWLATCAACLAIRAAAPDGGWFSVTPTITDWTGRTAITFDVLSTTGFDTKAAIQVGPSWQWCETAQVGWVASPRTGDDPVVVDLTTLTAECGAQLADVKRVNLYLNAGTHVIDDVELR